MTHRTAPNTATTRVTRHPHLTEMVHFIFVFAAISLCVAVIIALLRKQQEQVHQQLKSKGQKVTEHPWPAGKMGKEDAKKVEVLDAEAPTTAGPAALLEGKSATTSSNAQPKTASTRTRSRRAE